MRKIRCEEKEQKIQTSRDIQTQENTTTGADMSTLNTEAPEVKVQKVKVQKTITIKCVDCGAERVIPRGEAFQVKRCVECQKKHQKTQRKGYRKQKTQGLKDRIALLERCLQQAGLPIPSHIAMVQLAPKAQQ